MKTLGVFHSYSDPSAALVEDGRAVAFCEEERLLRTKHAVGYFPIRAVRWLLQHTKTALGEIDAIVQAWDCPAYEDGRMARLYDEINARYPTTDGDRQYQQGHLRALSSAVQRGTILRHFRREFGDCPLPPIVFVKHHLAHAVLGHSHCGFDEALVLVIDGSGEDVSTSWWLGRGGKLDLLHEVKIPHSLGWLYSAFTEYLGFDAYDGEYKVMGLAAYGKRDSELRAKLEALAWYDGEGGFETDPMRLARGPRGYSRYYPDALIDHMGRRPRGEHEEITDWHQDVAFAVQDRLEAVVQDMTRFWVARTGVRRLAVVGGVGLNVKMNGRLFDSGVVDDLFVHPLCADQGISIAGAMAHQLQRGVFRQERLNDVALGPTYSDQEIEAVLRDSKLSFRRSEDICLEVAGLLAAGRIVAWFQGAMEAGPRALGRRSILADPRTVEVRDRVNAVVKFREYWRPFCPSMTPAGAARYLTRHTYAPFMIQAFEATERARLEVPAVVHVDGTSRVQIVEADTNPLYHRLITQFEKRAGTPCLLNTSFNVKGEPIACSPRDAIRTFMATGLDALAIGPFLLEKDGAQQG